MISFSLRLNSTLNKYFDLNSVCDMMTIFDDENGIHPRTRLRAFKIPITAQIMLRGVLAPHGHITGV